MLVVPFHHAEFDFVYFTYITIPTCVKTCQTSDSLGHWWLVWFALLVAKIFCCFRISHNFLVHFFSYQSLARLCSLIIFSQFLFWYFLNCGLFFSFSWSYTDPRLKNSACWCEFACRQHELIYSSYFFSRELWPYFCMEEDIAWDSARMFWRGLFDCSWIRHSGCCKASPYFCAYFYTSSGLAPPPPPQHISLTSDHVRV